MAASSGGSALAPTRCGSIRALRKSPDKLKLPGAGVEARPSQQALDQFNQLYEEDALGLTDSGFLGSRGKADSKGKGFGEGAGLGKGSGKGNAGFAGRLSG